MPAIVGKANETLALILRALECTGTTAAEASERAHLEHCEQEAIQKNAHSDDPSLEGIVLQQNIIQAGTLCSVKE